MVLKAMKRSTWLSISVTSWVVIRDHQRFNTLPTKAASEDQGSILSVNRTGEWRSVSQGTGLGCKTSVSTHHFSQDHSVTE